MSHPVPTMDYTDETTEEIPDLKDPDNPNNLELEVEHANNG